MRGRPRLPLALEVCVSSLRTFILITQCSSELGKWRVLLPCVVGLSLAACSGRVGSTGAGGSQGGGAGLTVTLRAVPLSPPRSEERRVGKECRCRWGTDRGRRKLEKL